MKTTNYKSIFTGKEIDRRLAFTHTLEPKKHIQELSQSTYLGFAKIVDPTRNASANFTVASYGFGEQLTEDGESTGKIIRVPLSLSSFNISYCHQRVNGQNQTFVKVTTFTHPRNVSGYPLSSGGSSSSYEMMNEFLDGTVVDENYETVTEPEVIEETEVVEEDAAEDKTPSIEEIFGIISSDQPTSDPSLGDDQFGVHGVFYLQDAGDIKDMLGALVFFPLTDQLLSIELEILMSDAINIERLPKIVDVEDDYWDKIYSYDLEEENHDVAKIDKDNNFHGVNDFYNDVDFYDEVYFGENVIFGTKTTSNGPYDDSSVSFWGDVVIENDQRWDTDHSTRPNRFVCKPRATFTGNVTMTGDVVVNNNNLKPITTVQIDEMLSDIGW